MKTTCDTDDVLFEILKAGSLIQEITGEVYPDGERALNSEKEDVTINSLPITNEQLQRSISNVNIFVPDIEVKTSKGVKWVKNRARIAQLSVLAKEDLKDGVSGDFTWDIEQQQVLKDEDSNSHFINFRIEFFVSNI